MNFSLRRNSRIYEFIHSVYFVAFVEKFLDGDIKIFQHEIVLYNKFNVRTGTYRYYVSEIIKISIKLHASIKTLITLLSYGFL